MGACGALGAGLVPVGAAAGDTAFQKEAMYYEKLPGNNIRCMICPRKCVVGDSQRGYCGVRENIGGKYYTIVYARVCAYHIDPIEKKPLFHFLPGTSAFSIATAGCNMECKFCQNWEISQADPENVEAVDLPPQKVAQAAQRFGSPTIAYTYTEPIVYYEYVSDTVREGHKLGLRSVCISAGYINQEPLLALAGELDAIKIDLKSYSDEFYRETCSTSLQPVLDTLVSVKKTGTWLEIVNLIIPTLNDSEKNIDGLCRWVVDSLGDDVPIHFTRFYPTYKLRNLPPTPLSSVVQARQIALARGVKFPYVGNVPAGHPGESTYCPNCGRVVIKRAGYTILSFDLKDGKCPDCGATLPGIWS
jgi:pyruvate formate lyase activating enzyme